MTGLLADSQSFTSNGGFTNYYFVQSTAAPRYPYGICGPFSCEKEAENAAERIEAAHLGAVPLEKAGFATENASEMLARDQSAARLLLQRMITA